MNPCRHVPNGLGARNDDGLVVCGRCGHGYDDRDTRQPAFIVDAETMRLEGILVPCPSKATPPFLGSDASYLACSKLDGHDGRHTFHVEWGDDRPSQYAASMRDRETVAHERSTEPGS